MGINQYYIVLLALNYGIIIWDYIIIMGLLYGITLLLWDYYMGLHYYMGLWDYYMGLWDYIIIRTIMELWDYDCITQSGNYITIYYGIKNNLL